MPLPKIESPKILEWICAIDPGETTGICVAKRLGPKEFEVTNTLDVSWEDRFEVARALLTYNYTTVVVEDFRLYHHSRVSKVNSDFPTVRMIGYIELAMELKQVGWEPIKQPASVMKSVQILDEHKGALKGLHHARSAYRHLRYYVLVTHNKYI